MVAQHPSALDPRSVDRRVEGVANAPSDWPERSLANESEREPGVVGRTETDRRGVPRIDGYGVGRARDSERDSVGSSDAHRARTVFQLAASRCRDRVVLSSVSGARTDRIASHPRFSAVYDPPRFDSSGSFRSFVRVREFRARLRLV